MGTWQALLLTSFFGIILILARPSQDTSASSSPCALLQRALSDSQRIRPGVKRSEVEKYFKFDGGVQFPDQARYAYARCDYIKMDVQFTAAPSRGTALTSPDDTVTAVSKLYVEHPFRD